MAKYLFKPTELLKRVEPAELGLEYTSVQRIELQSELYMESGSEEVCLVCLEGTAAFECENHQGRMVAKDMIYLPRSKRIELKPEVSAILMRYGAPAHIDTEFAHLRFSEIDRDPAYHKVYGKTENGSRRDVWNFIDDNFNASRLLMGMCLGAPGGWTAWPPHEHAAQREEVYVYFGMGSAFAVQCIYEDLNNPLAVAMVQNGDLISVPKGYHPNVGCPGGRILYIYCMVSKKPGDRKFMDLHVQEIYGDKFD